MKKLFNIQWAATSVDHLAEEHYAHLFMLVRNGRIVYIGNCFRRNLRQLVASTVQAVTVDSSPVEIYLGRVVEFSRVTSDDIDQIHGMLVFARKPMYNIKGKRNFKLSHEILLRISGCDLFPEAIRADNWGVFLSQRAAEGIYAIA